MEIRTNVFKRRSGKSKGRWTVRISYYNEIKGKSESIERIFPSRTAALENREPLVTDIKKSLGQIRTGERMTFADLTEVCKKHFYKEAIITEGRKIEGVRSLNTALNHINALNEYFGKKQLGKITVETLKGYKRHRLDTGSRHPSAKKFIPVKLATINRELSAMRRMMRYAYAQGWVTRDVFFKAGVIDEGAEVERKRLLTEAEEARLLNACSGTREINYTRKRHGKNETITATVKEHNPRLKAMILLAIDSGLRRGEILKLAWDDFAFENNLINVLGTNTKTERARLVPLTERTKEELIHLRESLKESRPFPIADIKRSFATAKRLAGIDDLHFHDLRRTAVTTWIAKDGMPIAIAGKMAGHTQLQTTMKHYTAADAETVQGLTERMNSRHNILVNTSPTDAEFIN